MIKLPSLSTRSRSDTRQLNPEHALVSLHHPRSAASEAYRMLRTNIHFSAGGDELKVIQVTSAFPGEGKSLTASNLAITFAQAGSNVVLVDADMRRSNTHKQFELPASPGLSEAIVTGNIEASIKPGPIEGLSIVTAGTEPPNPSELLHRTRTDAIIDHLRQRFDLVIIDTTPVLAVADAVTLAPKVDGVLVVVNVDMTDRPANQRAVEALRSVKARVLGVVITGIKRSRSAYGYRYGYGRYRRYDKYDYYYYHSAYEAYESDDDDEGESQP